MLARVKSRRRTPRIDRCAGFFLVAVAVLVLCEKGHSDEARPTIAAAPRRVATSGEQIPNRPLSGESKSNASQHIQELIGQLGNPRYTARRAAASELRQIGADAFDLLHAATDHVDPEVAASAGYLLRQIAVRWVESDDSPAMRALLRDFGERSDESRLSRVKDLAKLSNGEGLAGLCRIAHFDRSPLVSRTAALAVIRPNEPVVSPSQLDTEVVERELGSSTRESAMWLRHYLEQLRDPAASADFWKNLVEEEAARLEQNTGETSAEVVLGLFWNLADVHRQLDDRESMLAVVNRMVGLDEEGSQQVAVELIRWLGEHRTWDVLETFVANHQATFAQSKRFYYSTAWARARQGRSEMAEQLAEKAALLEPQSAMECFFTARELEEQGQFDWAVREYRRAFDNEPVHDPESIVARIYAASLLQDYEQHRQAADALEPLVKAVQNEGRVGQRYTELLRYYDRSLFLPTVNSMSARYHFYRACQYRSEDDRQREKDELELAIKFDPADADVLIAMYRLPEQDPQGREMVRGRIRELCREFQREIDENPSIPTPYNQWAWLVSNTEGDFQKAIRYSHRSIELIPSSAGDSAGASFLDTLGRCYFAAGDYENAVKYQRQALEKADYMQVMHRQLAQFEHALAEKQGAEKAD